MKQPENDVKAVWCNAKRLFDEQRKGSLKRPSYTIEKPAHGLPASRRSAKPHFQAASICARAQAA
nr:hypothetical protein [uncultured Kingella sp.]